MVEGKIIYIFSVILGCDIHNLRIFVWAVVAASELDLRNITKVFAMFFAVVPEIVGLGQRVQFQYW